MTEKLSNLAWALFHPRRAMEAKARQVAVSIEHAQSPACSNMEDFPKLPVKIAARLLKKQQSGVPIGAWPVRDQERMRRGQPPIPGDHPEHPNI